MKNRVFPLVVCFLLVFLIADMTRSDWQIVYSDTLVNNMRKQGVQCPKRHGHFRTRQEAEAARKQEGLATGNYDNFMKYESWVDGFDDPAPPGKRGGVDTRSRYRDKQKRLIQEGEERRAKEQRERELERQRAFELGKRKLLKMLKGVGPSHPPGLKGAGGQQGLALKPAPIVDISDINVDEIEESQFFYDLQTRKTGKQIASLPSGQAPYYIRPNELTKIQNEASVTSVIPSKFLQELIGRGEEKLKDKLKEVPGAKGLIEAYETVKKAAGGIIRPLVMDILKHNEKLISQAAESLARPGGDSSSLVDKIFAWPEKNKEELEKDVCKFTGEVIKNKI